MFVGHYSVSYAGKRVTPSVPLWVLFLSVQFLDVLWGFFVLLGVERVRIVPGITATNPLDLYFMPYTHSLIGALAWSVVAALLYRAWRGRTTGDKGPFMVAAAVFSHWPLDLLVHRPDLPLIGDRFKVGLGLWNMPALAFTLEAAFLAIGFSLYLRSTRPIASAATAGPIVFVLLMLAVQAVTFFGAPPASSTAAAITALAAYATLAAVAGWLDGRRQPGSAPARLCCIEYSILPGYTPPS